MPDLPECKHSTFYRHPRIVGAAMATGHVRYCDKINPEHPDYDPRFVESYPAMSYQVAGLPIPENIARRAEEARGDIRTPREPTRGGGGWDAPGAAPTAYPLLADEEAHARVWEAARTCPHRKEMEGCCGPYAVCGPTGVHAGRVLNAGLCYGCSIGRLGLNHEPVVHVSPRQSGAGEA